MQVPKKRSDENKEDFVRRCMKDDQMIKEFPRAGIRLAACNIESNKLNKK